jgi:hypothetical protein
MSLGGKPPPVRHHHEDEVMPITRRARKRKPSPISRIVRRKGGFAVGRIQYLQFTVAACRSGRELGEFRTTQAAVWAIRKDARR